MDGYGACPFFLPFHTILADFLIQWTLSMAGHALSLQCLLSDVSYGHLSRNPMTKVVIGFCGLGDGEVGRRLLNLNGCNRSFLAKRPLFEAFLVSTCHRVLATALRMELSWLFAPFNCHALRSVLFVMAGGGLSNCTRILRVVWIVWVYQSVGAMTMTPYDPWCFDTKCSWYNWRPTRSTTWHSGSHWLKSWKGRCFAPFSQTNVSSFCQKQIRMIMSFFEKAGVWSTLYNIYIYL